MLQEIETSTQVNAEAVNMSAQAAEAVRGILAERKLEGYSLRVYVAGGGCSGVNFGMTLDNNIRDNDLTFKTEDVQVVVDDQSIVYLRGARIDFVNDPARGAGFTVDSPSNVGSGCSCSSKSDGSSAESGCGGSCGCS
jgi:iron-sulfur cluster assembly protein